MKRFAPAIVIALGVLLCGASLLQQRGCELPAIPGIGTLWPNPVPIAAEGLRVLIVEEADARNGLTSNQKKIILSTLPGSVRDYCKNNCVKVNDTPEFRLFDQHATMDRDSKIWQDAMARPRAGLPWMIISGGAKKGGTEFVIAPTMTDSQVLASLKRYTP